VWAGEVAAMRRAIALAADPAVRPGANPRVGCVLLDAAGVARASGRHRGAGTPHAEVEALAGWDPALGSPHTAVVTLEPCRHTGRTGPCTQALLDAGVRRVVVGALDPGAQAGGGAEVLRAAGVEVVTGVLVDEATAVDPAWLASARLGRPHVTWKLSPTLDGRVAAADGTARWISSVESRRDAHAHRARLDAIVVGTGTVLADDPRLTARDDAGTDLPREQQPLRVVVGRRPAPPGAAVLDDAAPTLLLGTHDPAQVLDALWERGARRVLVEGGPVLAGAFWRAGLVDEVVVYLAPVLLGAGPAAVADLGITTIDRAARLDVVDVVRTGPDLRITAVPRAAADRPAQGTDQQEVAR
jgi:diaminohydroxyphosphoribosylaminopyrimidine deaminase/5-amino-6-(5-phosphoribosylamino)uracil reductase